MPYLGIGFHVVIALFFAIHVIRTGREMYWLFVLFSFPLLGSVVYFVAVFLPQSRIERDVVKGIRNLGKTIDPGRTLREARQAFDLTPTAHNQMLLARALFEAGKVAESIEQFDACLRGPFAKDPEFRLGAATAKVAHGQAQEAIALLLALHADTPDFRAEQAGILLAKAYVADARPDEAAAEFESVIARFDSVEARCEYVVWAAQSGRRQGAVRELAALDGCRKHMTGHTRSLYRDLFKAVDRVRGSLEGGNAAAVDDVASDRQGV